MAYVPQAKRTARLEAQDRISHEAFAYDTEADVYRCPAGKLLRPTEGRKTNGKRTEIRYVSRKADCERLRTTLRAASPPRRRPAPSPVGSMKRCWNGIARGCRTPTAQMRRRAELAEHPFGTLKCRAGYRHFLVRGFDKVRGEWSLMALCYNFSRVLSILGFDNFIAYLAKRHPYWASLLFDIVTAIITPLQAATSHFPAKIRPAFRYAI